MYCPFGYGSQKSILSSVHTVSGNSHIRKGSNSVFEVGAKQGIHDLQVFSTNLSIPGNIFVHAKVA